MSQVRPPDAFVAPRRTWSWLLLLPILLAVAGLTNAWAISPNAVNRITAPHTATTAVAAPMTVPANIQQLAMTRGSGPRAAPLQVGGMSSGLGLTAHIRVAAESGGGILANQAAGNAARDAIAAANPGSLTEQTFNTALGARRVDVLTQDGLAIESKVGRNVADVEHSIADREGSVAAAERRRQRGAVGVRP